MSAKPTTTKNEALQGQSLLVRAVASALEIRVPGNLDKRFRSSLLRRAKADIAALPPGLLIRLFEAACSADFPDPDVVEFRQACERALAGPLGLSAYKTAAQSKP